MKDKTLFFRNLFVSYEGKEDNDWFHQATLYLASSFKKERLPFTICNSKFSLEDSKILTDMKELDEMLGKNPDINMIVITLLENCFDKVKQLSEHLRKKTSAYIVVGGIMPTLNLEHVLIHLPQANIIVKGEGEEILPKIQKILSGTDINSHLTENQKKKIKKAKGIIFRNKKETIYSDNFSINLIDNLDELNLDFSLLNKNNIVEGLNISTSRGCYNNCFFCTMPTKGIYRAKSIENLKKLLNAYKKRLIKLYGRKELIPPPALKLSFNDDDFLGDRKRVIEFFKFIKTTNFKINFIQTAINSFFKRDKIDHELIGSMHPDIFYSAQNKRKVYSIYIGTENFCDEELKRLGKSHNFQKIEKVVKALSKQGISQAHHLILTNTETTLDNLFENFIKIATLKINHDKYFDVLLPIIPNLVSLYPSTSYKIIQEKNRFENLEIKKWLKSKNHPDMNYPLVEKDNPIDTDVRNIAEKSDKFIKGQKYYESFFEKTLIYLLNTLEKLRIKNSETERIKKLGRIIDKYHNYTEIIKQKLPKEKRNLIFNNNKNNIQIMLTRRCPLRCTYCPIPKKDADMEYDTLKRTIGLLFTSKHRNLRIDFTGGEPLLRFDLMKKGINHAIEFAKKKNKNLSFYIVTNALKLTKETVDFLDGKNVLLELSIDGNEIIHNKFKIPMEKSMNPYKETIKNISYLHGKDINGYVVIVAMPQTVKNLFESFSHVISLGFNKIEINYAIGSYWDEKNIKIFFSEIKKIGEEFKEQLKNGQIELGNLKKRNEPAVLNSEFMIDADGSIKLLNEFLFKSKKIGESPYKLGTVFECENIDSLSVNKFIVYYSLVKMFAENDENVRKILNNNIAMGLLSKKFFKKLSLELKNDR